ncbi:hypothetical protein HMPREF0774_2143, partial [Staphylococcus aureus subsp. aureus TCH130]
MFYWSYSLVWPIVPLFQYDKPRPVEKPDSTFKKVYKNKHSQCKIVQEHISLKEYKKEQLTHIMKCHDAV